MFDGIGMFELVLIAVMGLVVLGPERLPVAVHSISRWITTIKRMANSVKDELEQELKIEQLQSDLKKAESKGLESLDPDLQQSIQELRDAAQSVNRPYKVEEADSSTSSAPSEAAKPKASDKPSE